MQYTIDMPIRLTAGTTRFGAVPSRGVPGGA